MVRALMAADAMTIPERADEAGVARAGADRPGLFGDDAGMAPAHALHRAHPQHRMEGGRRDTRCGGGLPRAAARRRRCPVFRARLEAGMGLVCNNVLHDRSGFVDDRNARACCTGRATSIASDERAEAPCRNG